MAEFRYDDATGALRLMNDSVYFGSLRIATLGTTETPTMPAGLTFYAMDHLGSPRLAHANGTVLGVYRYRSFGQPFTQMSGGPGSDFASMERDSRSQNHYDHARFYSDAIGWFLSPDKLSGRVEDPASWNRYTYVRNNPLRFVDPTGLYTTSCAGDKACEKDAKAFETARQTDLKSKDESVRSAAAAYGATGEANGVTVAVRDPGDGRGATIAIESPIWNNLKYQRRKDDNCSQCHDQARAGGHGSGGSGRTRGHAPLERTGSCSDV